MSASAQRPHAAAGRPQSRTVGIESPRNALIKLARALERKKTRQDTGLFLAEGARHVSEGLDTGWRLHALLHSASAESRPAVADLVRRAAATGAQIARVADRALEAASRRDNAQSVLGIFAQRTAALSDLNDCRLVVALERVRDPGNLGTILRTLDSVGGGGVVLVGTCCDPFSVEAVRASMGSVFANPVALADLPDFDAWRRRAGFRLAGASLNGRATHVAADFGERPALIMGNEQQGLTPEAEAACDVLVRLPMAGRADSLNLAVATATTLYEIWRRRGFDGARPHPGGAAPDGPVLDRSGLGRSA